LGQASAAPVSDVPASWSPSVPRAVEVAVRARFERLAVVRAGGGVSVSLFSGEVDGFSDDVEELLPGHNSSSAAAFVAPP
jgi:hypothetical protein